MINYHTFYDYFQEAPLPEQIRLALFLALVILVNLRTFHLITILIFGKRQQAKLVGYKRKIIFSARVIPPAYHAMISYEDPININKQTILKSIPLKNINGLDIHIFRGCPHFIYLPMLGLLIIMSGMGAMIIASFLMYTDIPFAKISDVLTIIFFILLLSSERQFHYSNKKNPFIRFSQQYKADKQIEEPSDAEYQELATPDRILTYAEVKKLQTREVLAHLIMWPAIILGILALEYL